MTPLPHGPGTPESTTVNGTTAPLHDEPPADSAPDRSGTLDEALERLHASGPERLGWLSNHAPMAVEALVRGGQAQVVHRWLDAYRDRLEDMPASYARVTGDNWPQALGDPRRITDWTDFFVRECAERPWRAVLAEWWPRLLPGIAGGATHPAIRVGHAVRTLLADETGAPSAPSATGARTTTEPATGPRLVELAHGLGYWAARHQPLPALATGRSVTTAPAALDAVPRVARQDGGIKDRLAQLTAFPAWSATATTDPYEARAALTELVAAAVHRYATHGHGAPVMLVHAATAPNAVLRTLPALPQAWWPVSLATAWAASAAVTAAYSPGSTDPHPAGTAAPSGGAATAAELFARAAAHGDDHTIKFVDTAIDVGGPLALAAARRAIDLNEPVF
ncbi:questin oxidase family protein [Streptomyces sp. NPDC059816]|uniref:questin oxidase family protein n=1 Tax=Streptomyces sp. NPDC059816 TaxID=3346960 RepID=UPI0036580227